MWILEFSLRVIGPFLILLKKERKPSSLLNPVTIILYTSFHTQLNIEIGIYGDFCFVSVFEFAIVNSFV